MKQYLTTLLPDISGKLTFHQREYSAIDLQDITEITCQFIERQFPTTIVRMDDGIIFSNHWLRGKVHLAQNFTRAFRTGNLKCALSHGQLIISYSGNLYRGCLISGIRAIGMAALFYLILPKLAVFLGLAFFILSYFLLVGLTKRVFPLTLLKYIEDRFEQPQP